MVRIAIAAPAAEQHQPTEDRAPQWVAAGTPEPLRGGLTDLLGEEPVLTRAIDLVAYASDASPYRKIPKAVVLARDTGDVVKVFQFARRNGAPLVLRAGGTSLNGQSQTDSILVDVRRHWQRIRIERDGLAVRVAPGTVLGRVNRALRRYGRSLGPDPASTEIACVGGVIANNSGGMRCGVVADSYRTVSSMTFVLPSGVVIDTAAPDAAERFRLEAPELAQGLEQIRDELRADAELSERVARKFEIKNTTGYRLCAFLDADEPLEIFRRLVIGSEGTLAFVAEAVFETVRLGPHTALTLALFEDVDGACAAVGPLVELGATATELMVAPTLIAAAHNMPGTPEGWKELPPTAAALLVELRAEEPADLEKIECKALEILEGGALIEQPRFSRDAEETAMLWHVREGLQGLLAAVRPPGVQLIMEDVCVPPARVAEMATDLRALLTKHDFPSGLAGHASAGNLHFLLMPDFSKRDEVERYDAFMHELVELIVGKYDGSLKAEHGTGLNMAPYVEREWGQKATELMWRVKRLADPDGILGPGIVLNDDPDVHLKALKFTPEIEASITKCIECGFCEPVCPSRNVTTTPRQRIVIRREMARQPAGSPVLAALEADYGYDAVDTCAADGSCGAACPVAIDTGKLIKELRHRYHSNRQEALAALAARRSGAIERAARLAVRFGGPAVRATSRAVPRTARRLPRTRRAGAAAVYLPACTNRIFGNSRWSEAAPRLPEALVAISSRAGKPVWIPDDVTGQCCGLAWSSKGFERGQRVAAERIGAALERWSDGGRLPVVIDASSCALSLKREVAVDGVEILDSIEWVHDQLLGRLSPGRKLGRVALHPNCSAQHLGLGPKLQAIASALADEATVPPASGCCGMAGDRGWLHPELPASALRDVASELEATAFDAFLCSNRTCEIALEQVTGHAYGSFVLTLERLTRA